MVSSIQKRMTQRRRTPRPFLKYPLIQENTFRYVFYYKWSKTHFKRSGRLSDTSASIVAESMELLGMKSSVPATLRPITPNGGLSLIRSRSASPDSGAFSMSRRVLIIFSFYPMALRSCVGRLWVPVDVVLVVKHSTQIVPNENHMLSVA